MKLDLARFKPGYKKPSKPVHTNGDSLNTAMLIMDRVENTAKRMQRFGEGDQHGDLVQINLSDHVSKAGHAFEGHCFADAKTGDLKSLKAQCSKEGEPTSHLSYEKDATGREVFSDSRYGRVVRSRSGALLQDVDGTLKSKLY